MARFSGQKSDCSADQPQEVATTQAGEEGPSPAEALTERIARLKASLLGLEGELESKLWRRAATLGLSSGAGGPRPLGAGARIARLLERVREHPGDRGSQQAAPLRSPP